MLKKFGISVAIAQLVFCASNSYASSITFDFVGNAYTNGAAGNVVSFSSGGETVNVSAWSNNGTNSDLKEAYLGVYYNGLGITNTSNDGQHTIDNIGYKDLVFLDFGKEVNLQSIKLNAYGDTDIRVWSGNSTGFSGGYANLATDGFAFLGNNYGGYSDRTAGFNSAIMGDKLIIAASNVGNNDSFKITGLTVDYASENPDTGVPEPSTVGLLVTGMLGLLGFRKKQST